MQKSDLRVFPEKPGRHSGYQYNVTEPSMLWLKWSIWGQWSEGKWRQCDDEENIDVDFVVRFKPDACKKNVKDLIPMQSTHSHEINLEITESGWVEVSFFNRRSEGGISITFEKILLTNKEILEEEALVQMMEVPQLPGELPTSHLTEEPQQMPVNKERSSGLEELFEKKKKKLRQQKEEEEEKKKQEACCMKEVRQCKGGLNETMCAVGGCKFKCWNFILLLVLFGASFAVILRFAYGDGSGSGGGSGGGGSFIAGTRVKLEDGTWQCIEEIRIGDRVALGGRVTARMEFESEMDDLFLYPVNGTNTPRVALNQMAQINSIIVAGGHAVLENHHWRRVRSSPHAKLIESERFQSLLLGGQEAVRVFDIDVERHRLVVHPGVPSERLNGMPCKPLTLIDNSSVVFADFSEVDVAHEAVQQFEMGLLNALQKSQNEMIEL